MRWADQRYLWISEKVPKKETLFCLRSRIHLGDGALGSWMEDLCPGFLTRGGWALPFPVSEHRFMGMPGPSSQLRLVVAF